MDAALSHSIVDLYARFKDYSLRPKIDRSPYGPSDEAEALLHSKPLNQLTWIEFGAYPGKAITTFGNLDDYKHFLPRILELITVESDEQFYIFDTIMNKLAYGKWTEWPVGEQLAIKRFFKSWFASLDPDDVENEYDGSTHAETKADLEKLGLI